jgi:glycogen debranching enzyme
MPVKINVGPPALTINQGSTFMVTDKGGEIAPRSEQGVFTSDTRFVSRYTIRANGRRWERLTSSYLTYYAARLYFQNPPIPAEDEEIPKNRLGLVIGRSIGGGIHEDLDVTNYGQRPARFNLEITLGSDFCDLFQVKAHHFVRRGRINTAWDQESRELHTSYRHGSFYRELVFRVARSDVAPEYANARITFDLSLEPGATWHACCYYVLIAGDDAREPKGDCPRENPEAGLDERQRRWVEGVTKLQSSSDDFHQLYRQSAEDMGALRMHEHDLAPDVWVPAGGVPWFVALFGRDSLIAGLQTLMVHPGLARGALKKLAEYQATETDDWRDAQPGKILHEIRFGELAHFHAIPHTPYYGTADATPLYLILLHETWKWTGDGGLLREYRDTALRCLEWIDRYGDLDGDGFQEYRTRSPQGYENQGWKDAGTAIVYPDGSQVRQPKGTCELQGYVFDAWLRMAEIFDALGEPERARDLRRKAAELQERFEERFWCEDIGCYALGLDPDKRPIETIASNAGHCLWSGIATPEHAQRVVRRLMESDMWSGWGIRTLSARNPAYNPFSYQRGSVWPHDNGIIAQGFKRYGCAAEAARVAHAVVEAASYFVSHQLPELYAGIERQPGAFPVQYLKANVPQGWAAGSAFHLLRAILGLRADAPRGALYVDPVLPEWLDDLTLRGLRVGAARVDVRFCRDGDRARWTVVGQQGDLTVEERPWCPWPVEQPQPG